MDVSKDSRPSSSQAVGGGEESVTPLLEASEAYPVLEEKIFASRQEVLLGFRLLDPATKLRSEQVRSAGLDTWGDLIAAVSTRGVDVRILLTDFEPTVATDLHKLTWAAVRGFRAANASEGGQGPAGSRPPQIVAALHEAKIGRTLRWLFWPLVWLRVRNMASGRGMSPQGLLNEAPGLAPLLGTRDAREMLPRLGRPPRFRPATYHQKLAIIDGRHLVIGGLDVDERRFDDPSHDRPAEDTWHDVSLLITGPVCADARSHFVDCWNREVKPFRQRLRRLRRFVRNLPSPPDALERNDPTGQSVPKAQGSLRFVRTVSRQKPSLTEFGPRTSVIEIERAHLEVIGQARDFIYIETQFLRSPEIVRALVHAAEHSPDLRLVLLVPSAPQEVLFEDATDPAHRHGEWLQLTGVDALIEAFGDRFAMFSLINRQRHEPTDDRRTIGGHPVVYIHSKVCIVDHRVAIVSSANLNGRSLRWDTEAGVVWEDGNGVRAFEHRLWRGHLGAFFDGRDTHEPADDLVRLWRAASESDGALGDRPPYVAPYPLEETRRFARRSWVVPDDLV